MNAWWLNPVALSEGKGLNVLFYQHPVIAAVLTQKFPTHLVLLPTNTPKFVTTLQALPFNLLWNIIRTLHARHQIPIWLIERYTKKIQRISINGIFGIEGQRRGRYRKKKPIGFGSSQSMFSPRRRKVAEGYIWTIAFLSMGNTYSCDSSTCCRV